MQTILYKKVTNITNIFILNVLKIILDELGVSAYEMARQIGVTPSLIYMITSGKREITDKMALLIQHHYGYNSYWIMGKSDTKMIKNIDNNVIYNNDDLDKKLNSKTKEDITKRTIELVQDLWLNKKIKNDSDFCRKIDIDQSSWVMIKNGKRNFPISKIPYLIQKFNVNRHWLLIGDEPMYQYQKNETPSNIVNEPTNEYKINNNNKERSDGVPFYDIDVAATAGVEMFNDKKEIPNYHYNIPGFEDCDFAVPVFGHSMYPTYENGTIIMCKKINDKTLIIYGEAYLIVTADYRMVKRLQKSEIKGNVLACSDNEEERNRNGGKKFEPIELPIDKIIHLYLIKGVIKRNQL